MKNQSIDKWILSPKFISEDRENFINYRRIIDSKEFGKTNNLFDKHKKLLKTNGNLLIHSISQDIPFNVIEIDPYYVDINAKNLSKFTSFITDII